MTAVELFMASVMYGGHRGGFYSTYGEMTMPDYDAGAAWNPKMALEASTYQCLTGEWMLSHDPDTVRVFGGTNYVIANTPWSTLSTLRSIVGNNPPILLTDLLNKYGTDGHLFFLDNKGDTNVSAFLDLIGSYAGPSHYIVKSYCTSRNTANAALSRGYQTWGYYYEADVSKYAATGSSWTILGMDILASQAAWDTFRATGKKVIGHTPGSASDKALADSKSGGQADGYMAAVASAVVPSGSTFYVAGPPPDPTYPHSVVVGGVQRKVLSRSVVIGGQLRSVSKTQSVISGQLRANTVNP